MANIKPPEGYTALQWAIEEIDKNHNVIGVCVDYLEPTRSRGTDYTSQFFLNDPSWIQDRGMKFRFFDAAVNNLPRINANGDVVIIRNVKTKSFNNQAIGMSTNMTAWCVLSSSSIMESTCPKGSDISHVASPAFIRSGPLTEAILRYCKDISSQADSSIFRPPPKSTALEIENRITAAGGTPAPRTEKWKPIKDLFPQSKGGSHPFADLFGEVRKLYYTDFGRVELSLTDYTTNKLLYNYSADPRSDEGDRFGYASNPHERWPGPWGRMTITVTLFDAHAHFAKSSVQPGMYVLIRNCQIKLDQNGSKLEALCRGDRDDMSKVNVHIFQPHQAEKDERFKHLLRRRLDYEKEARSKGQRFGLGKTSEQDKKRSLETIDRQDLSNNNNNITDDAPKRETRSAKRKRKKAEKAQTEDPNPSDTAIQSNQYVRCNNVNVPVKSISDILDPSILQRKTTQDNSYYLPFQNSSYKCRVRVVDYYPNDLADFSVPVLVSDYDCLSDTESPDNTQLAFASAQSNPNAVRWEWRFFIIVEDAHAFATPNEPTQRMALLVADQEGEYLLNDEAVNLRANPKELAKLKEKLFVLWGDLQERKEEATAAGMNLDLKARSRPFECFVNEYGVPIPGEDGRGVSPVVYQRMFRLFGTSI